jgi:hypothetical protein
MTDDLKTERLRGLIREFKLAAKDISPAGVENGEIREKLLLPLMVAFHAASALLFIASEQNPDWREMVARFTGKGE